LQQQGGETFLCVNDHLGMPKDLVSGDGLVVWTAAHSAYGRVIAVDADLAAKARYGESASASAGARGTATGIESPFRLLGQIADEDAELGWTRFRCFDAESGRWLSDDPLGIEGGFNRFGFDGSPTRSVDPLGQTGSPHPPLPDDAIVIRNGECKPESFVNGSGVVKDADGKLSGISTSSKPGLSTEELSKGTPNGKIGVTTVGDIRKAGGEVTPDPTRNNPNHALVSGITDEQATQLFKPQDNPTPKAQRPRR
jgi:RHS repeat-associated protein